jgi:phosphoglycolate phosphatase
MGATDPPTAVRAAIFDLDGTLLDSLCDLATATGTVLRQAGYPDHPLDAYRRFIGDGATALVRRALPPDRRDPPTVETFVARMLAVYRRCYRDTSQPYPGIAELLDALQRRGLPLAVLSNKPEEFTARIVDELFGRWHFAEVRGSRPGVPRKPDPTAALSIAEALDLPAAACAYVGDTPIDIQTAIGAGMRPVGVLWGFRQAAELRAAGARHLLTTPGQLLDLIAVD